MVYGHGMDPLSISVDRRELRHALSGAAGMNTVLDLTVDGTVYPAIIKDIQRHPVRRTVPHIDFIQVNLNEEIVVVDPDPPRGRGQGGRIATTASSTSRCRNSRFAPRPRNIPDEIVIDITEMTMDTVIRVETSRCRPVCVAEADAESDIVTVLVTRSARPMPRKPPTKRRRPRRRRRCCGGRSIRRLRRRVIRRATVR